MDANTIALLKPSPLKRLVADEKAFKENLQDKQPFVAGGTMRQCLNILVDETKDHGFATLDHMLIDNHSEQTVQAAYAVYTQNADWEEWKDTCTRVLASLRRAIKGIKGCLNQLALETNDNGITSLYNHEVVQAAYEVYTEDAYWEEWKDTCTHVLAYLRKMGINVL